MRELLRHFAIFTAITVALVGLAVAGFIWVAEGKSSCIKNGGMWDAAIDWCRRHR